MGRFGTRSIVVATALFCALLYPAIANADELRVVHYGGTAGKAMRSVFFDLAEKEMNTVIVDTTRTDMAKIKVMVESGNIEWDVANVNTLEVGRGALENLWAPIDWNLIDPKVAGMVGKLEYGVPFYAFSMGLAYNTKTYPDPSKAPRTWADFWDVERFPGPRALENRVRYTLDIALLADGVAPGELYPLDVERAFRKLDEIKPHIVVWAKPPVQTTQLVADGEVVMAPSFNNEMADAQSRGAPVAMQFNGALFVTNSWSILKNTPNLEAAQRFIQVATQPAYEAKFAELTYLGPMNPDALPLIDPKVRGLLPTETGNLSRSVEFGSAWWAANEAQLIERWNKWLLE